jgi:hypothetical protein
LLGFARLISNASHTIIAHPGRDAMHRVSTSCSAQSPDCAGWEARLQPCRIHRRLQGSRDGARPVSTVAQSGDCSKRSRALSRVKYNINIT